MPKFLVNIIMQFGGTTHRAGSTLEVTREMLEAEIAQGLHRNGKPNSGLLNHCSPYDDETAALCKMLQAPISGVSPEASEEEKQAEIEKLRGQMDEIGAAYDKRWGLERLRKEVVKARLEKGEPRE